MRLVDRSIDMDNMIKCTRCKKKKSLHLFRRDERYKSGFHSWCLNCRRKNQREIRKKPLDYMTTIKRKYGLLEQQYIKIISEQHEKCAICGNLPNGKRLGIDHNHKTGEVRGLLCDDCNYGLGRFKDDPLLLKKAILYIGASVN